MRADGKRTGVTEKFSSVGGVDAAFATNDFSWEYDAAGRLISETAEASGGSLFNDYSETFVYDLTGNRVKQTKVSDNSSGNGSTTETTDYVYDANDRLLIETNTVGSDEKTSVYTYNKTQQTEKETTEYEDGGLGEPVTITTTQTFEYDLQGKLSKSTTTKDGGQALGSDGNSSTVYEYDSAGNRIAATTTRPNTVGGSTTTRIEYLTDSENPTGYSQVLTETEFAVTVDANGNEVQTPIKEVVYTIGHDQISQTIFTPSPTGEGWGEGSTQHFGTDGHGSVRVLYDAAAAIASNVTGHLQIYHFDAYGNLLNENAVGKSLTVYLYSGEAFDFNINQQYLRARWYDPTTGRFNSLDPFAGNSSDPQSFHKYAYVHGDPIQGVDPTGMFWNYVTRAKSDLANLATMSYIRASMAMQNFLYQTILRLQMNALGVAANYASTLSMFGPAVGSVIVSDSASGFVHIAQSVMTGKELESGNELTNFQLLFYASLLLLEALPGESENILRGFGGLGDDFVRFSNSTGFHGRQVTNNSCGPCAATFAADLAGYSRTQQGSSYLSNWLTRLWSDDANWSSTQDIIEYLHLTGAGSASAKRFPGSAGGFINEGALEDIVKKSSPCLASDGFGIS